ncbi:MAG: hypothetical protein ABSA30_08600 [Candidatus Aminicenantales bacterium]
MKPVRPNTLSLIIFRIIIVTTLLLASVIIQLSTAVFLPLGPFYLIVLGSYASCLVFLVLYLRDSHVQRQAYAQIIVDVLIITLLVYITGGISGQLYVLYIFPILAAGLALPGRAAYLTASLSAIFFGIAVLQARSAARGLGRPRPVHHLPGLGPLFRHRLPVRPHRAQRPPVERGPGADPIRAPGQGEVGRSGPDVGLDRPRDPQSPGGHLRGRPGPPGRAAADRPGL